MIRDPFIRGFTLIEMIVSVGLFALVMLVAMSTYFTLISVDRQARASNQVVSNLSFAVDAMTRGIRTGTNYKCVTSGGDDVSGTCKCFSYTDTNLNATVSYHVESNGTIGREVGGSTCLDANSSSITDPSITIDPSTGLIFYVRGTGNGNDVQSQVLFSVKGTMPSGTGGKISSFVLEENDTQRLPDL